MAQEFAAMTQQEYARLKALPVSTTPGLSRAASAGERRRQKVGRRDWHNVRRVPPFLVERVESRVLLSAVTTPASLADWVAHTTFVAYHPAERGLRPGLGGDNKPYATTSPTGLTPAQMRHAYGV